VGGLEPHDLTDESFSTFNLADIPPLDTLASRSRQTTNQCTLHRLAFISVLPFSACSKAAVKFSFWQTKSTILRVQQVQINGRKILRSMYKTRHFIHNTIQYSFNKIVFIVIVTVIKS